MSGSSFVESSLTMDIRVLGDDNREIVVTVPATTTANKLRTMIADKLLIPQKHALAFHAEKMLVPTDGHEEELRPLTCLDVDRLDGEIITSKHLQSGDTIYISDCSSFSDPNVWKLNVAWDALMDVSSTLDGSTLMPFIELLCRVAENIVSDPHNERFRHLNLKKVRKKCNGIPKGMRMFKFIGFVEKSETDFNFYAMHSLQPIKHLLKLIYLRFPELRPKDATFMAQFESFDTEEFKFEVEKAAEDAHVRRVMEERKEQMAHVEPDQSAIIPPSNGTVIAGYCHSLLENIVLFVILGAVAVSLVRAVFKI